MMLTPDLMAKLKRSLIKHEDYRKYPYVDTVNKITIGIGYNMTDRGIDDEWINTQYLKDVTFFYNQLCNFPWYLKLNADRQIALVDMAFMGWQKFLTFKKMIAAFETDNMKLASFEALNSKWAEQVKGRAATIAQVILTGVYDI